MTTALSATAGAAVTREGASEAELAVMREAAGRVLAQQAQPPGEDPFTALARPFIPDPGGRSWYHKPGTRHFCTPILP